MRFVLLRNGLDNPTLAAVSDVIRVRGACMFLCSCYHLRLRRVILEHLDIACETATDSHQSIQLRWEDALVVCETHMASLRCMIAGKQSQ